MIGAMRDLLEILTPTVTDDSRGGQVTTWPTSGVKLWGYVRAASSREQANVGVLQTVATHTVTTHYDARITADKRLKRVAPTGPTLEIVGIRDADGKRRMLDLDCTEVI